MKDIRPVKIFVNSANEGEIVCPKCEKTKTIHLSNNRITTKPIRVKCNCGYSFSIVLEYRNYHRKIFVFLENSFIFRRGLKLISW